MSSWNLPEGVRQAMIDRHYQDEDEDLVERGICPHCGTEGEMELYDQDPTTGEQIFTCRDCGRCA